MRLSPASARNLPASPARRFCSTPLNQYHVVMEVDPKFAQNPDALKYFYVTSPTGKQLPLDSIARYTPSNTSLAVNHSGQFPSVTISFNLTPGFALGDAVTEIE